MVTGSESQEGGPRGPVAAVSAHPSQPPARDLVCTGCLGRDGPVTMIVQDYAGIEFAWFCTPCWALLDREHTAFMQWLEAATAAWTADG